VIGEPHLNPVSEDRHDHRLEDPSPPEEREAMDRVPQNSGCADGAPGPGSEGLHMERPRKAWGEEHPEVVEGGRRRDVDAFPDAVPKSQSFWLYP
jgi:hypothetical protein